MGTQKVINEHSTIGLVITTDGSITDIPREEYAEAEQRVIEELELIHIPWPPPRQGRFLPFRSAS